MALLLVGALLAPAAASADADHHGGDDTGHDAGHEADGTGVPVAATGTTADAPGLRSSGALEGYPHDDDLRLNHLQVVGSHNSYKLRPPQEVLDGIDEVMPGVAALLDYEHPPLTHQFDHQGIRQIELDIFNDPDGGLFTNRVAYEAVGLPADPGIPELEEPGIKVLHAQEVDPESNCWTFVSCLEEVRDWSLANPGHAPLMILVEAKEGEIPDPLDLGFLTPIPFGADELDAVDDEIRSVFDDGHIITPDEVRGGRDSLSDAVTQDGWPTLGETRGRVLFALDNTSSIMHTYLDDHPALDGRVMFTGGGEPGDDHAAFFKHNDPVGRFDDIQDRVAQGYIVRTRADADPTQSAENLFERRDLAIDSGAQFVSTDFQEADDDFDTGYEVQMPGGTPARCNPISAPDHCRSGDIEHPVLLGGEPGCDADRFDDVAAADRWCALITWLAEEGITTGYPDGTFRPTATLTRQAVAVFLHRLAHDDPPTGDCTPPATLTDIDADHPFCHEITWLAEEGITTGYPDGTFRPTATLTRQAIAAFAYRFALWSGFAAPTTG